MFEGQSVGVSVCLQLILSVPGDLKPHHWFRRCRHPLRREDPHEVAEERVDGGRGTALLLLPGAFRKSIMASLVGRLSSHELLGQLPSVRRPVDLSKEGLLGWGNESLALVQEALDPLLRTWRELFGGLICSCSTSTLPPQSNAPRVDREAVA